MFSFETAIYCVQQIAHSIRLNEYRYEQKRKIKNSSIFFRCKKSVNLILHMHRHDFPYILDPAILQFQWIFFQRFHWSSHSKIKTISDHQIIALVIKLCARNFHVLSYLCMIEFRKCEIFAFDLLHFHNIRSCPKTVRRNRMI